ncbi:TetR/AcrR family transcriptional regulator, partial [Rhodococcus electrodiphilus]|nr:TetR/AcrR family transcriptional regulator [Rhodococcus ruber]
MAQPRRRLDPEQRRAQLLDIGARLFAERAYDDVW